MRKVIISLAPVEAGKAIDKEKLVEDVVRCEQAGAAMCHLHCRRPDGSLTPDISELTDTFERIAEKTDLIIQASTGGVSDMSIEQRCNPLDYWRVESASLNGGTTNLGEAVYINTFEDIRYCAKAVYERKIIPEIEVFDIGMIYNIRMTQAQVPYREPVLYNLVFGHRGGMQANMECLTAFLAAVPGRSPDGALPTMEEITGISWQRLLPWAHRWCGLDLRTVIILRPAVPPPGIYEEVEKLAALIRAMDLEVASPAQAREILHIFPKGKR